LARGASIDALAERALDPSGCPTCGADSCSGCSGFQRVDEGAYRMTVPEHGIELRVDRLRRRFDEQVGELRVECRLPQARTISKGLLGVADLNLSSLRARQERAKYLGGRVQAKGLDWTAVLEEFAQLVIAAERDGQPAQLLRDIPRPKPDDVHLIDGFPLLARHPVIVFGDGGCGKSLVALNWACKLEQAGVRTAVFDWELAGEDHRERAERLFPGDVPALRYVRCERPLIHDLERLRRIVRDERLDYVVLDSIAFACDGPPEAAEVASRYFQATRRLGPIGSLHVAHVSKAEGADRRPFGSAFWHNGARSTWFCKMAEPTPGSGLITLGLFHRKSNLGALRPPLAYEIQFGEAKTTIRRTEAADNPDLASGLSVRLRMAHALRGGSLSAEELANQIDADLETVRRTARRYRDQFVTLPTGQLTLKGRS